MLKRAAFLLVLLFAVPLAAQPLDESLPDPAQEQRARDISRELRCLVCQNQSIEDSNAPLARDLRRIVRERVAAGDSNNAVLDYLVARYGEWVLLKPRFNRQTLLLWLGPLLFLVTGGAVVTLVFRRNARTKSSLAASALSPDEQQRLGQILADREESR